MNILSVLGPAAVLAAGIAALAWGRTDIRAAHRAQSFVLWGVLGLGLLGFHIWTSRIFAATPEELVEIHEVHPAANGPWLAIGGRTRGIMASFLFDAETRRSVRLRDAWEQPAISMDGQVAVWSEGDTEASAVSLRLLRLAQPGSRVQSPLTLPERPNLLVLDDRGERVAVQFGEELSVYEVSSGRRLASTHVTGLGIRSLQRGFFVGDAFRYLRLVADGKIGVSRLRIFDLDIRSGTLSHEGDVPELGAWVQILATRDGSRLLVRDLYGASVRLVDGFDGRAIARLDSEGSRKLRMTMLRDGRPALADRGPSGWTLRIFSTEGILESELALPEGEQARFGGEWAPGRLIVGVGSFGEKSVVLADAESGEVRHIADGLNPASGENYFGTPNLVPVPGSAGTRLFLSGSETLVRLDPATGARTVVLGKASR